MKKGNKKVKATGISMGMVAILVILLGFLVYQMGVSRDSRSSANDGAEAGVVLPVASDME